MIASGDGSSLSLERAGPAAVVPPGGNPRRERSNKAEYRVTRRATIKPMSRKSIPIWAVWMRLLVSLIADMLPVPVVSVPRAK